MPYSLRGNPDGVALGLAKSCQYYNSHGTAHSFKGRKVSTHTTGLDGLGDQCSYQSYCTSFPAPPVPLRASVPIRLVPTSLSYPRSLRPPPIGGPQLYLFISVSRQSRSRPRSTENHARNGESPCSLKLYSLDNLFDWIRFKTF